MKIARSFMGNLPSPMPNPLDTSYAFYEPCYQGWLFIVHLLPA